VIGDPVAVVGEDPDPGPVQRLEIDRLFALPPHGQRGRWDHQDYRLQPGPSSHVLDEVHRVGGRRRVGHGDHGREPARRGCPGPGDQVLLPGLARVPQVGVEIDKARPHELAGHVPYFFDGPGGGTHRDDGVALDPHVGPNWPAGAPNDTVDQADHQSMPPTASSAAMRTGTPQATWSRISDRGPSATSTEISTPRLIGPGCMTTASGFIRADRSKSS